MGLRSFFSRSSDLERGDTIEVLDDSGEAVEATYKGKGKHARGRIVVTYTQGCYTGRTSMSSVNVWSARKQSQFWHTTEDGTR